MHIASREQSHVHRTFSFTLLKFCHFTSTNLKFIRRTTVSHTNLMSGARANGPWAGVWPLVDAGMCGNISLIYSIKCKRCKVIAWPSTRANFIRVCVSVRRIWPSLPLFHSINIVCTLHAMAPDDPRRLHSLRITNVALCALCGEYTWTLCAHLIWKMCGARRERSPFRFIRRFPFNSAHR